MADGPAFPESRIVNVITIAREPLSVEWSPAKQYREGAFLIMHLGPKISNQRSSHRLVNLAKDFATDPMQEITLEKDIILEDGTSIRLDWGATAKKSGINGPERETAPNLSTLTINGLHIPETDETIAVDFNRIPRTPHDESLDDLEFGVQKGAKASESQVIAALWSYLKKIRTYYNQNRND